MKIFRFTLVMALALCVWSCAGYRQAGDGNAPLDLPEEARALFITSVENPTMNPDLESLLRAEIRDEFTRRGRVAWVDRDQATAYMRIKVNSFRTATSLTDEDETTIRSSSSISLEAWITAKDTGQELWRGSASHSENFSTDQEAAEADVMEMAARKLADRLNQAY